MGHKEPLDDGAMPLETDQDRRHLRERVDYLVTNIRLLPPLLIPPSSCGTCIEVASD